MITLRVILGFLCGRAEAIYIVATSRTATVVGFFFVLSAGLAREYDGEDLTAQPWHLALPLAASVIGCFALSLLVWIFGAARQERFTNFQSTFWSFLNVYWMTAPMAWLYAIPVERFLSPVDATRANLALLAVVATWRVALMIRCVCVLYRCSVWSAIMPVMLFSDALALLALNLIPGPVFMIMGGVRLTESESMILGIRMLLGLVGVVSAPVWLIGYLVACSRKKRLRGRLSSGILPGSGVARATWLLIAASLLVWIPVLPLTQPEQKLRFQAEQMLRAGQFEKVCQLTREYDRKHFPPHWDAPPRVGYGEQEPNLIDATFAIIEAEPADWFRQMYEEKFEAQSMLLGRQYLQGSLLSFDDNRLEQYVVLLERMPNRYELALMNRSIIEIELSEERHQAEHPLTPKRRQLLGRITKIDRDGPIDEQ